jgi:aminoglycoside/choline kinase family phosphotransferase
LADRAAAIAAFLAGTPWRDAGHRPLAGDASARRYLRLSRPGQTAVLMDAPHAGIDETCAFCRIAAHLGRLGLSAPEILRVDPALGLILMGDLGDGLFSRLAEAQPETETALCIAAADLLAALHAHPAPDWLPAYDAPRMAAQAALVLESYAPATEPDRRRFETLVRAACERLAPGTPVLMLRDFHAGNLVWLPGRRGVAQVGLLDFQDAMAGHPAYDLVSLLQDARRDVPPAAADAATARYLALSGADPAAFADATAVLGAVRQLRILGVFARLAREAGKPGYLAHMPRVWRHLTANLANPGLADLAEAVAELVPEPTPGRLEALRCPSR